MSGPCSSTTRKPFASTTSLVGYSPTSAVGTAGGICPRHAALASTQQPTTRLQHREPEPPVVPLQLMAVVYRTGALCAKGTADRETTSAPLTATLHCLVPFP